MLESNSSKIRNEIVDQLGFLPPFFEPALATPRVLASLWDQTKHSYLFNPWPAAFKEKLAALIGRFCPVPYCLVCHSAALRPLGMNSSAITKMLSQPIPSAHELREKAGKFDGPPLNDAEWPPDGSFFESLVLNLSVSVYLDQDSDWCLRQLRNLVGFSKCDELILLIAYNRTCLQWAEAHPEISYASDRRVLENLDQLAKQDPGFEKFLFNFSKELLQKKIETSSHPSDFIDSDASKETKRITFQESESRLRSLLDSTEEGIWGIGLDGKITFVNSSAIKLFGYDSSSEMIGKNSHELVHYKRLDGSHFPQNECGIYRAFQAQVPVTLLDEPLWKKDGTPLFADYRSTPVFREGEIQGAVVTFVDTTEKKRLFERLQTSEQWLSATLKSIGDAVIATTACAIPKISFMNAVAEKLTGYSLEEARGKPVLETFNIINQKTRKRAINPIERVLKEGVVVGLANHTALISKSGEEFVIEDSAAPIHNLEGKIEGVVLVFRDVTEAAKAHENEVKLQEEIANSRNELLSFFMQAPVPICVYEGADHRFLLANAPYEKLVGRKVVGRKFSEVFDEAILKVYRPVLDSVLRSGEPFFSRGSAVVLPDENGNPRELLLNIVIHPLREGGGAIKGLMAVIEDVTDQARQQLLEKREAEEAKNLANAMPQIVWASDSDGAIYGFNDVWYGYTGLSAETSLGNAWTSAIHPDDLSSLSERWNDAVSQASPFEQEVRIKSSTGEFRWHMSRAVPIYNDSGAVSRWYGTSTDVHAEKLERIEASAVLESMSDTFFSLSEDWIIQNCNSHLEKISGLPKNELIGKSFLEVFLPTEALRNSEYFRNYELAMREKLPVTFKEFYSPLGIWTEIRAYPKLGGGIAVFFSDISQRVELEKNLESARAAAEQASEAKSAFLANMSHEIRTPLGAIMGFADLSSKPGIPSKDLSHYLSVIKRNSFQLLRIIDDILDLSKVEARKLDIECIRISLPDLLHDVFSLLGLKARENGVDFRLMAGGPFPEFIQTDPTRLRQILVNLVGNAIKFSPKGQVCLLVSYADTKIHFRIKDSGQGISPEQASRLFQAFSQADMSTTRNFGGTGLGLALSRDLARAMGGDLILESSALGEGSTFAVSLEAGIDASARLLTAIPKSVLTESPAARPLFSDVLEARKILLVEDSSDNQALIRIILEDAGAFVTLAVDGSKGLDLAIANIYDAIVMDVQMPNMDGITAVRLMREEGLTCPIVALTAHAMKQQEEKCLRAGFSHFLPKPVKEESLIGVLAQALPIRKKPSIGKVAILLVEDDLDTRELLTDILTLDGFEVFPAASAEAALDALANGFAPKIVFTDLTLPEMSGEELIRHLNERNDRKSFSILVSSGWSDLKEKINSFGADDFIQKPLSVATLPERLKALLSLQQQASKK